MASRLGSPNRAKVDFRVRLEAYCRRYHVDPFEAMVHMLADETMQPVYTPAGEVVGEVPTVPIALKFQCAKELAQYLQPKLRSVMVSGDPVQPFEILHRYGQRDATD